MPASPKVTSSGSVRPDAREDHRARDDRGEALDRLTRALEPTVVLGLTTNLRFLRWLVREPVIRDGQARTDTLDRIWPPDDWGAGADS